VAYFDLSARRWATIAIDVPIVVVAYLLPLLLRFDGAVPALYWSSFWAVIPWFVVAYLGANLLAGTYSRFNIRRAIGVNLAVGIGMTLLVVLSIGGLRPLPLSVLVLGSAVSFAGLAAIRVALRRDDVS
jgi:FlaA1/EpsC-like NDP-sugar epimerase